ncbi:MAG: hypothetical protein NTV39_01200 [Candidatus Saccharibacteria bacterium]|nr:hypothetical protein [Candidatus Saccharibacteria bacterium]
MYKKKLIKYPNTVVKRRGFTLVEMVIIAPIVIIVLGGFILAIINMVGAVIASRGSNALAFNVQQALSQIDQDVAASSGYLAVNNVAIRSPQGFDNQSANFKNADATNGAMLILNTYATTSNPISSTRNYVYAIDKPYACASTLVNQNTKITINIIYFVKNVNGVSSLWRRTVAPSDYASAKCGVPWQKPSCSPIITDAFCTAKDEELVDGVQPSGFNVSYFVSGSTTANVLASDATQTDTMRQAAMDPTNTVNVQITAGATMAGRDISRAGSIRSINLNSTYKNQAPQSPVADWLATPQGDHVGNFYDLVTHNWATVSRVTPSTIYDPATQKIYDVPANYLGVRPRSDGKTGNEAVIEEARTNYLLNSSYSADTDSDGTSDNWYNWKNTIGTPTFSRPAGGVYGSNYQREAYTATSDAGTASYLYTPQYPGFAPGDTATESVYLKGFASGVSVTLEIRAYQVDGSTFTGYYGPDVGPQLNNTWQRFSLTSTAFPAGTVSAWIAVVAGNISTGDSYDISMSAAQLEKGPFATSYIPTTTSSATRAADSVTVPTTNWNVSTGTMAIEAGDSSYRANPAAYGGTWQWSGATGYLTGYSGYSSSQYMTTWTNGVGTKFDAVGNSNPGYHARLGRWSVGSTVRSFFDGVPGTMTDNYSVAGTGMNATAIIGSSFGNYFCGPIQRITNYSSALTDPNISIVTSALQTGT